MTMRHHTTTQKKTSQVLKTIVMALCGLALLSLAACNLFIEDEQDWKEEIPVHTGYGYDEPVTENGEFYDLTYQFNSNVNVLSEDAMRHLNKVLVSRSRWISCLDFDLNTPKELRPVRGEILLHGICDKLPEGMMQQVLVTAEMDGVYRVITCVVPFEDLFKEIDMEVDCGKGLYLQSPDDNEEEAVGTSWDEMDGQQDVAQGNRVRKVEDKTEKFSKSYSIALPITFSTDRDLIDEDKVKVSGKIEVGPRYEEDDDNKLKGKISGKLRALKTSNDIKIPFSLEMKHDVTYQANLNFVGQVEGEFKMIDKSDVLPESCKITIMIGSVPIVFKLCMGVSITAKTSISHEGNLKFRLPLHTEFQRDLFDLGLNPVLIGRKLKRDLSTWSVDTKKGYFAITQSFKSGTELEVKLTPGVGIFTDKLSLRAICEVPKINFDFNSPKSYTGNLNYGWDIRNKEGVDFGFTFALGMEVTTPSDVVAILNGIVDELADKQMLIGRIMAYFLLGNADAETANSYFQSVQELNDYIKSIKQSADDALDLYGVDPVPITEKKWSNTWYPTLEEEKKPFKYRKKYHVWSKKKKKYEDLLHVEYYIKDKGILASLGTYTPCLMVADKYYNYYYLMVSSKTIGVFTQIPDGGMKVEFDIPLADLPEDEDILLYPGFYEGKTTSGSRFPNGIPWDEKNNFAFDKPHEANTKVPSDSQLEYILHVYTSMELPTPIHGYRHYRSFLVCWKVIDPKYATKTQLYYSEYPNESHYADEDPSWREGNNRHFAVINCFREFDNDPYIDVQPCVTLGNDKSANTKLGSIGVLNQYIEDGQGLVFNKDGSCDVITGKIVKNSNGSSETKWGDLDI